ncbi:MAG: hypothetical protein WBH75_08775, partial [Thermoanaerobaculia bacterium]
MQGARLRHSGVYVAGSATLQDPPPVGARPSRRNRAPTAEGRWSGARGLRPHAALGLVTDDTASHSSARLACD